MGNADRDERSRGLSQLRQVERALREFYIDSGLIESSDLDGRPEEERDPRLLSRALTAQAVRMVTGFSHADAALAVIDGVNDQGIDAIAVVTGAQPHVYIVQGKWSKNGRAKAERSAVLEMAAGLRRIDDEDFASFNPRGQQLAEQAKAVMSAVSPVTQVYALMRADDVTDGFDHAVAGEESDFNRYANQLDHRVILVSEIWDSVRNDLAPPPVELEAELSPWYAISVPYESYQGVVDAAQVAEWISHGSNLFSRNIRNPLGLTAINSEVIETLTREPAHFWYFNNGITILCEGVEKFNQSMRNPHARPLGIRMRNASVVNGAQTVRSIVEAVAQDPEAGTAQVGVRIITTGSAEGFARQTTQATNRQNRVEARDYITLDKVQAVVAEEMRAELGLEYSVRRSDDEPLPTVGCSVVEAATALACLQKDSQFAARIATTRDVLWERGSQGIYDALFHNPRPGAFEIWNAVRVLRAVRQELHALRPRFEGRGSAIVEHGTYLIAHLAFRRLDTDAIAEPDSDGEWWTQAEVQLADIVGSLVPVAIEAVDDLFGDRSQIRSVCADVDKCRDVVTYVLDRASSGIADPDKYRRKRAQRRTRRPNAVTVLIDRDILDDGDVLTLSEGPSTEAKAIGGWLAGDLKRGRATWTKHRKEPLVWAVDGQQYSPSGLVTHIWDLAGWEVHPVAVQGTARWVTASSETLADLAWKVLNDLETTDDEGAAAVTS